MPAIDYDKSHMNKIVECVPNFSEGRELARIDLLVKVIESVPDVFVLDREMDADHHRSVITFAGEPEAVIEAAVRVAATASELIDLNQHKGQHPRIGALDVLPFVPIKGVTMDDCVRLARRAGERIANELEIPVYLYERAATRPDRVDIADIRRGEFEALKEEIATLPERRPDFGEPRVHPTAGATAVGARPPLIAYNINLASDDISIAKRIAKSIRGRDGGLRYVKALGMELKNRRQVQVSINLVNYEATPLFRVFEMVRLEAARYGVNVAGSEIIGLVPQAAINACGDYYLRIENFSENLILENRLQAELSKRGVTWEPPQSMALPGTQVDSHPAPVVPIMFDLKKAVQAVPLKQENDDDRLMARSLDQFAAEVAEGELIPDGANVAAYVGALAASLGTMVASLTIGHKAEDEAALQRILEQLEELGEDLKLAVDEESESSASVLHAIALPRDTDGEKLARTTAIEEATKNAVAVPLRVSQNAMEVLELLSDLSQIGDPRVFADMVTGAQMALAAMRGASYHILCHLLSIKDEDFNRFRRAELSDLVTRGQEIADDIEMLFFRVYPR